jgi:hypothetical protein
MNQASIISTAPSQNDPLAKKSVMERGGDKSSTSVINHESQRSSAVKPEQHVVVARPLSAIPAVENKPTVKANPGITSNNNIKPEQPVVVARPASAVPAVDIKPSVKANPVISLAPIPGLTGTFEFLSIARVLYPYQATFAGGLTVVVGEILTNVNKNTGSDWY